MKIIKNRKDNSTASTADLIEQKKKKLEEQKEASETETEDAEVIVIEDSDEPSVSESAPEPEQLSEAEDEPEPGFDEEPEELTETESELTEEPDEESADLIVPEDEETEESEEDETEETEEEDATEEQEVETDEPEEDDDSAEDVPEEDELSVIELDDEDIPEIAPLGVIDDDYEEVTEEQIEEEESEPAEEEAETAEEESETDSSEDPEPDEEQQPEETEPEAEPEPEPVPVRKHGRSRIADAVGAVEKQREDMIRSARAAREASAREAARKAEEARRMAIQAARAAEAQRRAEEAARLAEEKRKAEEEARFAEERRKAEEARIAEEKRLAEEARLAEERRIAEEKRRAEEERIAEEKRLAEERRKAEEARIAAAIKAEKERQEEIARLLEERRQFEEQQRLAEEKRLAEEARLAEERRIAEEKRRAEEARLEEARKTEAARLEAERRAEELRLEEENKAAERRRIEEQKAREAQQDEFGFGGDIWTQSEFDDAVFTDDDDFDNQYTLINDDSSDSSLSSFFREVSPDGTYVDSGNATGTYAPLREELPGSIFNTAPVTATDKPGKGRNGRVMRIIMIAAMAICLCVAGYSLYNIISINNEYKEHEQEYKSIVDEVVKTADSVELDDHTLDKYLVIDHAALRSKNGEYIGWIRLEGTVINYPVTHTSNNDKYINHSFEGRWSGGGCIFMDYRCSADWSDFHTILYGHHLNDKTMFWPLNQYRNKSFWDEHQTVEIYVPGKVYIFKAFSFYKTSSVGDSYDLDLRSDQSKSDWIALMKENSLHTSSQPVGINDKVLTLSTCVAYENDNRWVLHLVLTETVDLTPRDSQPETQVEG